MYRQPWAHKHAQEDLKTQKDIVVQALGRLSKRGNFIVWSKDDGTWISNRTIDRYIHFCNEFELVVGLVKVHKPDTLQKVELQYPLLLEFEDTLTLQFLILNLLPQCHESFNSVQEEEGIRHKIDEIIRRAPPDKGKGFENHRNVSKANARYYTVEHLPSARTYEKDVEAL